jgi:hypothetical protein
MVRISGSPSIAESQVASAYEPYVQAFKSDKAGILRNLLGPKANARHTHRFEGRWQAALMALHLNEAEVRPFVHYPILATTKQAATHRTIPSLDHTPTGYISRIATCGQSKMTQ